MSALDMAKALDVIARKGPKTAMCPRCPDEVLVMTFRWPGAEFWCPTCEGLFGFLDPRPAEPTPELDARCDAAKAAFVARFAGDDA